MITEVTATLAWIRSLPKGEQIHGYPATEAAKRLEWAHDMLVKQEHEHNNVHHHLFDRYTATK